MRIATIALLLTTACGSEPWPTSWYGTYEVALTDVDGEPGSWPDPFLMTFEQDGGPVLQGGLTNGLHEWRSSITRIDDFTARYYGSEPDDPVYAPRLVEDGQLERVSATEVRCADLLMRLGDTEHHAAATLTLQE